MLFRTNGLSFDNTIKRQGLLLIVTCALSVSGTRAQDPQLLDHFWMTNGYVWALEADEAAGLVYLGGTFSYVYPNLPNGSVMAMQGEPWPDQEQMRPNSYVNAVVADGNGGWFIGGAFTQIGTAPRSYLAHLGPDGDPSPWSVECDHRVHSLALADGILYIGGEFTSLGGQPRSRIGAVDAVTGMVTAWDPGADEKVEHIEVGPNTIYVTGDFDNIGGQARERIAALDHTTGAATPFDAQVDLFPIALQLVGNTLYVGGAFTQIGGQPRQNIAALDAGTGNATAWDPGANQPVKDLLVHDDVLYVGGDFSVMGGAGRERLGAFDLGTGVLTAWAPQVSDDVLAMEWGTEGLYVSGLFGSVNGQVRLGIAAIDPVSGEPTSYLCHMMRNGGDLKPNLLCSNGTHLYIGGSHIGVGSRARIRLAAIDAATGRPTDWRANANDQVNALALGDSTLYVGGLFTTINGTPRDRIAEVSTATGQLRPWDPDVSGNVLELAVHDTVVHALGDFAYMGGVARARFATIGRISGDVTPFVLPLPAPVVGSIIPVGDDVIVGSTVAGSLPMNRRMHIPTATVVWTQNDLGGFYDMVLQDTLLLVASGSGPRVINANTGESLPWPDGPTTRVVEPVGQQIWFGGNWSLINGEPHGNLAFADSATGALNPWDAELGSYVNALAHIGSRVFVGGVFTTVQNEHRQFFAAFETTSIPTSAHHELGAGSDRVPRIHPNPSHGQLVRISWPGAKPDQVRVFNSMGSLVRQLPFSDTLDLSELNAGPYMIHLVGFDGGTLGTVRWISE